MSRSSRVFLRLLFLAALLFLSQFSSQSVHAQWEKLVTFNGQRIETIHFLDYVGHPEKGFLGLLYGPLYATEDTGHTWHKLDFGQGYDTTLTVSCFSFKDYQTGWLAAKSGWDGGELLVTKDGGKTWSKVGRLRKIVSVYYHRPTKVLITASWSDSSLYSTDDGLTWKAYGPPEMNGCAFSSDSIGVVSVYRGTYRRTTDGGLSWLEVPKMSYECWQPFGIPNSSSFLAASELYGAVFFSSDNGSSWKSRSIFPSTEHLSGATIGDCRDVYVQTEGALGGLYLSSDHGATWQALNGPSSYNDTRFHISDEYLYAAQNTDASPSSSLWRYRRPPPTVLWQLPDTVRLSSPCHEADTTIRIRIQTDACDTLEFLTSYLEGSQAFSIVSNSVDSDGKTISLKYNSGKADDRSWLHIRIKIGKLQRDSVVALVGSGLPRLTAGLEVVAASAQATPQLAAGDTAEYFIRLMNSVPDSLALTKVRFKLYLQGDFLSRLDLHAVTPWQLGSESPVAGGSEIELVRSDGSALPANAPLVSMKYRAFVASSLSSTIKVSEVAFNDFPASPCIALTGDSLKVDLLSQCGDSLLRAALSGKLLISNVAVVPNPSAGEPLRVRLELSEPALVEYAIRDVLGNLIDQGEYDARSSGRQEIALPQLPLASHPYYLLLTAGGEKRTVSFVVEK